MDFTSLVFLFIFLPVFLTIYLAVRQSPIRLTVILIFSIVFILAGILPVATLFWLVIVSAATYAAGHFIEKDVERNAAAKRNVWLGIVAIVSTLIFFKAISSGYGDGKLGLLFCGASSILFFCNAETQKLIIPLGISYITFQSISYVVDVYRKQVPHEKNFIKFFSYMLYFPKLVSGPITSYKSINKQLEHLKPGSDDTAAGIRRIFSGVIKRILIANQAGLVANAVFGLPISGITPAYAWLGLLAYTIQIYFDFSGYTDIAIGLARTMGITLPENFNYPYMAQSISDFWRRWHMTLSTWFREYIFFPLERRRAKFPGRQVNILIVFLLTGLWHGFNPTFIVWGLIHGAFIAFESAAGAAWLNKIYRPFRHIYTLTIVLTGWIFFRSPDITFALGFIGRLFGNTSGYSPAPFSLTTPLPIIEPSFVLVIIIGIIFSTQLPAISKTLKEKLTVRPAAFISFQTAEDVLLILFFVFAIASQIAGSLKTNIYANF